MPVTLQFDKGTLILQGYSEASPPPEALPEVRWDPRTSVYRAPGRRYREIVLHLRDAGIDYEDHAKNFAPCELKLASGITPRDYQEAAVRAWKANGRQGIVVLPTGAGKTILAVMLINVTQRPTLVHVPTIDLMHQWVSVLETHFGEEIGLWGGGYHETRRLTVATYDSALIHVSHEGNAFGFVIFDECHHLPSDQYQFAAIASLAPFRLGLTATPERTDGREALLYDLLGGLCYRTHIDELEGKTLAPYVVKTLEIELTEAERALYEQQRAQYIDYLKAQPIDLSTPDGWRQFLFLSSQSAEGRRAFQAYLTQKRLSQAASGKEATIWELLREHRGSRIIIFTQDNDMAYRIGKRFFLPVLTHQTKLKERKAFLEAFREGDYPVLVTSKVLNEGVDVPEANVAIVVSGSGSIREHVQRLGRILRARPGKQAILYELVAKQTGEHFINQRRRQHRAYERFG